MTRIRLNMKKIAVLTSTYYLFLLVFSSFNTHSLNLQNNLTIQKNLSGKSIQTIDPFLDDNSKCRLSSFTNDKYIAVSTNVSKTLLNKDLIKKRNNSLQVNSNNYFPNLNPRAPPAIS